MKEGWTLIEPRGTPPAPRKSSAIAFLNGCIYVFGGNTKRGLSNDIFRFDCSTQQWSQVLNVSGSPPSPRDRHTMVSVSGKLWVFGGHTDETEFMNDLFSYDPKRKRWTKHYSKTPPQPRYEHCATALGARMVIAGGKCRKGGLIDINIFDPELNRWSKPQIRGTASQCRWGASCVAWQQRLIFFGGWNGRDCFNDIHLIDTRSWEYIPLQVSGNPEIPAARTFHVAGILEDKADKECRMLIVAGRNMIRRLNDTTYINLSPILGSPSSRGADATTNGTPFGSAYQQKPEAMPPKHESVTPGSVMKMHESSLAQDFRKKVPIDKNSFVVSTTLGTGSFGRVRLCKYKGSLRYAEDKPEYFALKMLRKTRVVKMKQENHIKWEKKILTGIRHPFIVNLEAFFQDRYFLYLVLELVQGGEFFSLLRKTGVLQLPHAAFYASQIVLIFQFLHKNKIVYRDLKPENLLIGKDGYLKLTDFGFAKRLDKNPPRTWTLCGTPEYIAPEILLNKGHSFSVDWWALGILLFEMFTGNPPFVDENPMRIYQKILDAKVTYPTDLPKKAQAFIAKLLTPNLSRRLGNLQGGAMDVMLDPFFNSVIWRQVLQKKVRAPYIPRVENDYDTQHFDEYAEDSDGEAEEALANDPFLSDWC